MNTVVVSLKIGTARFLASFVLFFLCKKKKKKKKEGGKSVE